MSIRLDLASSFPSCQDVSMIQESHVGVGILGKEGAHAAMSADFVHVMKLTCTLMS
jgi:hypothetical protein